MKRFVRLALTGMMFVSFAALAPTPPPASALTVCVGTATVVLSTGLGLPGTINTANFAASTTTICPPAAPSSRAWSGIITGACGLASGWGTTSFGADFSLTITGTTIVVTGEINGTGPMVEDPFDSGSCLTKTATQFLLTTAYVAVP